MYIDWDNCVLLMFMEYMDSMCSASICRWITSSYRVVLMAVQSKQILLHENHSDLYLILLLIFK